MTRRRRTKKNIRKKLLRYGGGFGLLVVSIIFCLHTVQVPANAVADTSPLGILSHVPAVEMPARAVALVQAAPAKAKIAVLTNTVWAVGGLARPGVMPYVVSALCRANPDLADVVVATALAVNNTPPLTLLSAAKAGAPGANEKIAVAAFQARPADFASLAVTLAETDKATNVLRDLGEALPNLQPFVDTGRIQADQMMPAAADDTETNLELKQVSQIMGYTLNAITNSGQTIEEVLTNDAAGGSDLPADAGGTNAAGGPGLTNLQTTNTVAP